MLFLSAGMVFAALKELESVYGPGTPAAAVYRASWPEERIIEATVSTLAGEMKAAGMDRQAIIFVGDTLRPGEHGPSKLYDPRFSHGYRRGEET